MFLKKIICSGFKSFADRVVISLDKGITGIVGPNGSGKSNVIDAVRWVMGEQNAKNLRGEKATDIIFAGSERRKSLGMAEVSLVFDNSDDSVFCPPEYRHETEISLTRRLYADGQREYMINKKPCRFKDIVGFFATTGLGGRSYSMIQQGQVERILNAKPEDVREIIEEAAGTMVFKNRKAEAERKLEQTNLNMSRIEDILAEVEKQIGSLENQVAKAKEYQELSDKLREDEVSLFAHNYHHFRDQLISFTSELELASLKEAETIANMAGLEVRHTELQSTIDESDPELQVLQEKISIIREKIARSESTLKSGDQRIEMGAKRLSAIEEELKEDDANLKVLETQVDAARNEMGSAESSARSLQEAIENFEYEVESADEAAQVYQGRMDEFEDEIRNLERLIESNKFRTESAETELAKTLNEIKTESERTAALQEELARTEGDLRVAEEAAGNTKAGLDKEIREKHDREGAVAQRYSRIKTANQLRDTLKERYHTARARYTSLQELDAGATDIAGDLAKLREGDPHAASAVKGLIADFVAFTAAAGELPPKAAAAFERWAERAVVDSLDGFNDLVRAAGKLGLGSIPVCLLSRCEEVDAGQAKAWAESAGAESLRQFLKVEDAVPGVSRLIDRLYLLPSLALDEETLKQAPDGLVVFTSQGVTFAGQDDFVIGGKAAGGLLSRKTELEKLAEDLKVIEVDLGRTQAEIDQLDHDIHNDRAVIAEIDAKLQQQNAGVIQVLSALQAVQQLFDRKKELIDACQASLTKARANEARLNDEKENLSKNRFSLQRELATAKTELTTIEEESQTLVDRREETKRMHDTKKLELARFQARAQALRDSFANSKAQLELLQNKLARRYEERLRIAEDTENATRELAEAKGDIQRFLDEREALESDYSGRRAENADLLEELRVIDSRLRGYRDDQSKLTKQVNDKSMAVERLKMGMAGVTEQAIEKYKLDLETFAFQRDLEFNYESRTRSVQRLRSKIESIGAVNMMALEEFEEKTTRRDFITKQRDEVISSIDLLQAAIAEIEDTSLRKFLESFEQINREFGGLFPILFPTGEGKLELTNPENPLIGGIEILCRLPGKSQKPMSLFSGGEKALTAMALIFALLKTKPTPFCFLDEVDAPLDEANVGRYNRVLEALAHQFQFIVITHNRRTMEVLDTLYGITMQEPGVSKVVGVDMQKDLPAHLRKAFKEEGKAATSLPADSGQRLSGATAQ